MSAQGGDKRNVIVKRSNGSTLPAGDEGTHGSPWPAWWEIPRRREQYEAYTKHRVTGATARHGMAWHGMAI
ncbi:hypothetical protein CGMCC3_g12897 [Colletotrichum fructicola]|nr:uncharacterized protein CGMCC3_g12897 [Colletotrichum fructicola]KAE9571016.1 hypothetical protein CGMCC3_g12897 [Colletotrichum fructicola]